MTFLHKTCCLRKSYCLIIKNKGDPMKKKILAMAFALASLALPACAENYTLRPGDQLNIVIVQEQDISSNLQNSKETPYTVRPDGTVSFPLVGQIQASGMTVDQFTRYLRDGLSRYYVEPDVTVNIVQLGGRAGPCVRGSEEARHL